MPSGFDAHDVDRIIALANLTVTDEERARFGRQLADILAYARQVQDLDTSGVVPAAHALSLDPVSRADEPGACLNRDEALGNAPNGDREHGLFKVPRVIGS